MSETLLQVEKADEERGIIQFIIAKARPAGSGEYDDEGTGLDPEAMERAFGQWVANYGKTITYWNPATKATERKYNGVYDSHRDPMPGKLHGAWWFPAEMVGRVQFEPDDRAVVAKAKSGRIRGSSWSGSCAVEEIDE